MTNKERAEQHIADALAKGFITLDGAIRAVPVGTIIQLARAVVKDEISKGEAKEREDNIPSDIFNSEALDTWSLENQDDKPEKIASTMKPEWG